MRLLSGTVVAALALTALSALHLALPDAVWFTRLGWIAPLDWAAAFVAMLAGGAVTGTPRFRVLAPALQLTVGLLALAFAAPSGASAVAMLGAPTSPAALLRLHAVAVAVALALAVLGAYAGERLAARHRRRTPRG